MRRALTDQYFSTGRKALLALLPLLFLWTRLAAGESLEEVWSHAPSKSSAFVAYDLSSNKELFSRNASIPLKPASTLKLVTAATALGQLGVTYAFETSLILTRDLKTLAVRGGGDPIFTVDHLHALAEAVDARGVSEIDTLYLDTGRYIESLGRSGGRAYETAPSPLSLNFNSAAITICPSMDGRRVLVSTSPKELNLVVQKSVQIGARSSIEIGEIVDGSVKVSGTIEQDSPCIVRYRSMVDPVRDFGKVFLAILKSKGIAVRRVERGTTPPKGISIFTHRSDPLSGIVHSMNHFSTNMIAESLVYALGCEQSTCSRDRGLKKLQEAVRKAGANDFHIEDGSGLSHANRVSASTILQVMLTALRDPKISPEFEGSLSIGGVSGTLKRRIFNSNEMLMRGKTGSLDGVSSLAGVVYTLKGNRVAYVALENDIADKERANKWEERIVNALYQSY